MQDHSVPAEPQTPTRDLDKLCHEFLESKKKLDEQRLVHAEIEEQILRHFTVKDSGSTTVHTPEFKVEVQFKQDYKFDEKALRAAVPADVFTAITRQKFELDVRTWKKMKDQPAYEEPLTNLIEAKSQKPYIQVKYVG
jgi:hypothetical protein